MLKRIFLVFNLFFVFIMVSNIQASNTYSSVCNRACYVKFTGSYKYKYNLGTSSHGVYLGKVESNGNRLRTFFQWDLSESQIPNASIIKSATLTLTNINANSFYGNLSSFLDFSLFSVRENLLLQSASADSLWARTDSFNNRTDYIISGAGDFIYADQNGIININKTYNEGSTFTDAIAQAIANDDFFTLGMISNNEIDDPYSYDFTANAELQIVYEDSMIIIDQKRSDGVTSIKTIRKWQGTAFSQPAAVPDTLPFVDNQYLIVEAYQDTVNNPDEKYIKWDGENDIINHHEFIVTHNNWTFVSKFNKIYDNVSVKNNFISSSSTTGGSIEFKDPWFIDSTDAGHANAKMNRGNDALFHSRTAPFYPNFNSVYDGTRKYLGVFLNQGYDEEHNEWNPPYYEVKAQAAQQTTEHGDTVNWYFQGWGGSHVQYEHPDSYETPVVFTDAGAVAKAYYKGLFVSAKTDAYSSNSQRKIVRNYPNGDYNTFYTDGYIDTDSGNEYTMIYTTHSESSGFSGSWSADLPLLSCGLFGHRVGDYVYPGNLKNFTNPSVSVMDNGYIFIVFEAQDDTKSYIYYADYNTFEQVAEVSNSSYGTCKPVIGVANGGKVFIAWNPGTSSVLKYRVLKTDFSNNTWGWLDTPKNIPNTSTSSVNITLVGDKVSNTNYFHMAWQDGLNGPIKYQRFEQISNSQYAWSNYANISSGSGLDKHKYPSIALYNKVRPIVTWQGSVRDRGWDYPVVTRTRSASGWGSFHIVYDDMRYSVVNASEDNKSVIAYVMKNGYNRYFTRNASGAYSSPSTLSPAGADIHLSNGYQFSDIKSITFKTADGLPYMLKKSTMSLSKLSKTSSYMTGRKGVIVKGVMEFVFEISDVMLNGQNIQFSDYPDTLAVKGLKDLNDRTRSVDMNLNKESELLFSHKYYVVNEDQAEKLLSDNDEVKFKVELVRSSDDYVVGVIKEMVYNKNNADAFESKDFKLDCSGLKADNYYLRLKTAVKGKAEYFMGNGLNGSESLEKKEYEDLEVAGVSLPLTYELQQNYPNPFNPVTSIAYAVPNAGKVTITVYDIRGRMVKKLLDTYKEPGRYTVKFDGKALSSGLYIYRLKSGDFITERKMLLVK